MQRKSNHLIYNEHIDDKIAHLLSIDESRRPFVASEMYKEQAAFLLNQISYRKKAAIKLPLFYQNNCLFTEKALAQATSEIVAKFKANLMEVQNKMVYSLTGGLGVDDYFIAQKAKKLISIDTDEALNELVNYNYKKLNALNIERITGTCEDFLEKSKVENALVFIDPDRRINGASNKQVAQYSPNIFEIIPNLCKTNNQIFIKLAGIVDIDWIKNNIPYLSKIYIIAHKNEVKEVLILCQNKQSELSIESIEITDAETIKKYDVTAIENLFLQTTSTPAKYLFQPLACIAKQRAAIDAIPVSENTALFYTNITELKSHGKLFEIIEQVNCNFKELEKLIIKHQYSKTALTARNAHGKSEDIAKKLKLKSSDTNHLFLFGNQKKYLALFTKVL